MPGPLAGRIWFSCGEPPGVDGLAESRRFSSRRLAEDLVGRGIGAAAYPDTDALLEALAAELKPGDLALVMSNGGFDNLHQRLLERAGVGCRCSGGGNSLFLQPVIKKIRPGFFPPRLCGGKAACSFIETCGFMPGPDSAFVRRTLPDSLR